MAVADSASISSRTVDRLRTLAQRHLGIEVRPGKELLVSLRAAKHMRELGLQDEDDYLRRLESDASGAMLSAVLDRLTTNHTSFYREPAHFEFLRTTILPGWREPARASSRTIWSAASSSGEEPYTLAICVLEELGAAAGQVRVLATDVSDRMLQMGRTGVYPAERLDPLPAGWSQKYFLKGHGPSAGLRKVKPEVAAMVHFRKLNLTGELPRMGPFPVIFCRNVMIYFDAVTRAECVGKLVRLLDPGGYLMVGHAESLNGIQHSLEYVQPAVYRRTR